MFFLAILVLLCVSNTWHASSDIGPRDSPPTEKREFRFLWNLFGSLFFDYSYEDCSSKKHPPPPPPPPPPRPPPPPPPRPPPPPPPRPPPPPPPRPPPPPPPRPPPPPPRRPPPPRPRPPPPKPPPRKTTTTKPTPPPKRELKFDKCDDGWVPKSFDARTKWPKCPSFGKIRDQGHCQASWAFAVTSLISDRICICSRGKHDPTISAEDAMSCCSTKDKCTHVDPCQDGDVEQLLFHYLDTGIVTGGGYGEKDGCKSYSFISCINLSRKICPTGTLNSKFSKNIEFRSNRFIDCDDDYRTRNTSRPICEEGAAHAKKCVKKCDAGTNLDYKKSLYKGKRAYRVCPKEKAIQGEIYHHGPVTSTIRRYEDFRDYHGGIYRHRTGDYLDNYHVKLIGWGEENGTPYWLGVNSQNEEWGEKGFFRILRGKNEVNVEKYVYAALPLTE